MQKWLLSFIDFFPIVPIPRRHFQLPTSLKLRRTRCRASNAFSKSLAYSGRSDYLKICLITPFMLSKLILISALKHANSYRFIKNHKHRLIFIVYVFIFCGVRAQEADQLFLGGKFEDACSLYELTKEKNAQVNFRLGYCFFKGGMKVKALVYLRKAYEQASINGKNSIDNVINLMKQDDGGSIKFSYAERFYGWALKIPLIVFQSIFLFLWCFILFYLSTFFPLKPNKILTFLLFLLLIFFGILLAQKYRYLSLKWGIVNGNNISVLSGPNVSFYVLGNLKETSEVQIISEFGEYFKVKSNNMVGFVKKSEIEVI